LFQRFSQGGKFERVPEFQNLAARCVHKEPGSEEFF
jgi:hypothetical protein